MSSAREEDVVIRGNTGTGLTDNTVLPGRPESAALNVSLPHKLVCAADDTDDAMGTPDNESDKYLLPELKSKRDQRDRPGRFGKSTKDIIGPRDDRVQINDTREYPWRAICLLVMSKGGRLAQGTGWFAGPNSVVTAAHNLFDNEVLGAGWVDSVQVSPAINGENNPWKSETVQRPGMAVSSAWRARAGNKSDFDFAVIKLSQALGQQTGWFTLTPWDDAQLSGKQFNVVGYPGPGQAQPNAISIPKFTLWGIAGLITNTTPFTLHYQMDTTGGESGSPVFARNESNPDGTMIGVGIHTQGQGGQNQATRITNEVIQEIKNF